MVTRDLQRSAVSRISKRLIPLLALVGGSIMQVPTAFAQCPLSMTLQPVAQSVCAGGTVTLRCTAAGTGLTYRWARSTGGSGFLNLSDNARIGGNSDKHFDGLNAGDQGTFVVACSSHMD